MHGGDGGVDVIRKTSSGARVGASACSEGQEPSWEVLLRLLSGNPAALILADTTVPRTLPAGRCRHGRGHEEGLWETLVLLQIPGQVPTAASAEPVPQPHQAVGQKG